MPRVKNVFLGAIAFALATLPFSAAYAITCPDGTEAPPGVPCAAPIAQNISIYSILNSVVSILFYVLMFLAIIMILIAAFQFLTAQGDEEKVKKSRAAITYAVIAIVIAVLARSVPFIVRAFVVNNVTQSSPGTFIPFIPGT